MQILVKFESFVSYQKKYGTVYLDKKNKYQIWSPSKQNILNGFQKVYEMFDGIKTKYDIQNNNNDYLITFTSNSGNEYRLDLIKDIKYDIYHIAFSLKNSNKEDYEKLTDLKESKEIFAKLAYILKDVSKNINIKEYCIGATGDIKKDKIYEYIMKYTSSWEKRETDHYNLGWSLYFTI
jgi:hypothetical protein